MKWFKNKCNDSESISDSEWLEMSNDEYFEVKLKNMNNILYCDEFKNSYTFSDKGEEKVYLLYVKGKIFSAFSESQIEKIDKIIKYECDCCNCCNCCNCRQHYKEKRIKIIRVR
jgi:hypothetical protein